MQSSATATDRMRPTSGADNILLGLPIDKPNKPVYTYLGTLDYTLWSSDGNLETAAAEAVVARVSVCRSTCLPTYLPTYLHSSGWLNCPICHNGQEGRRSEPHPV